MNSKEPHEPDLSPLLRKWQVNASLPPRFEEGVWQAIEKRKAKGSAPFWMPLAQWLRAVAARPAFAGGLTALLLLGGLASGLWQGERAARRTHTALSTRYL